MIALKVTLVLAAGLAVARATHRARASVRHLVLTMTLVVAAALPMVEGLGPGIDVRVPPTIAAVATMMDPPSFAVPPSTATAREAARHSQPPSPGIARLVASIWLAGAVLSLAPVAIGWWHLGRLRRTAVPWPMGPAGVHALAADRGVDRTVALLVHEDVLSPMTLGTFRPAIVLPVDARQWDDADLRRALVHELEHVRRSDWITQTCARVVCAGYWFHPLAWMVWRRLRLDAERACDDAVIEKEDQMAYARQLVALAERFTARAAQPTLGMAQRSDLSARVASALDPAVRRGRAGVGVMAAVVLIAAMLLGGMAPLRAVPRRPEPTRTAAGLEVAQSRTSLGRQRLAVDRELLEAARAGDLRGVTELLAAGADADAALDKDGSPLIAAARQGHADVARHLLDNGANPNLAVRGDGSPLIAAATSGHVALVALLLDRGASIDRVVPDDENALIGAAGHGALEVVQLLVSRGADVNARVWAPSRGADGQRVGEWRTPLSVAQRRNDAAIVSYLRSHGARE